MFTCKQVKEDKMYFLEEFPYEFDLVRLTAKTYQSLLEQDLVDFLEKDPQTNWKLWEVYFHLRDLIATLQQYYPQYV
jgi:hypothetical protein